MLLEVRNLSVEYYVEKKRISALDDVSFSQDNGEILGVIGESGSGKTTLAKAIIRAIRPPGKITKGEILFDGEDILKMNYREFKNQILWREISYVPQASQNSLNGTMKIIDHFYDTAMSHGMEDPTEIIERAKELLKMVNLDSKVLEMYPHELSGGMKQRVLIALSLLLNPQLVIMDEPVSALDVVTQKHILDNVRKLNKELNIAIIFITHDIALAKYLTQKLVIMYGGEVMEVGKTEEIMTNPYHPYTTFLLKSIPSLRGDISQLKPIREGEISLSGCPFSNRCEYATDMCKVWTPESYTYDRRVVRCINYANKNGKN
ncbi:ABC transporter ATP-binding protein [Acidianus manzaensis]|uniref:ABC transporter ATP-binding protein n=1 Tax=Acidianus manzaensis TaxID=282676 RepID=A0A1W6JZ27_9CREN|nr:ABC transporter ATP-binding protein [Acidianus manzaensis]ARM75454.1 ABC transporter ATP-binding protein [Acidianus manzaensis]